MSPISAHLLNHFRVPTLKWGDVIRVLMESTSDWLRTLHTVGFLLSVNPSETVNHLATRVPQEGCHAEMGGILISLMR